MIPATKVKTKNRSHIDFMIWMQEKVQNIYSYKIDAEIKSEECSSAKITTLF